MKTKKEVAIKLQSLIDQQSKIRSRFPHTEPITDIKDLEVITERLILDVLTREIKLLNWILS